MVRQYEWIQNIPLIGGYGSGPIEKTVDITVARRFKKRGMSWYKSGADPLLRLRLLKLNGEWDTYWQQRRKDLSDMQPEYYHGKRDAYL